MNKLENHYYEAVLFDGQGYVKGIVQILPNQMWRLYNYSLIRKRLLKRNLKRYRIVMKIHKKINNSILCNAVKWGNTWYYTSNPKKVTCRKCLALMKGIHVGEMYQFDIPKVKLTDEEVEVYEDYIGKEVSKLKEEMLIW